MSISEPFIRRPIATSLLMLGVMVFGIVAYGLLPIAALPQVDFPTITVTANYPGASPTTMASAIATDVAIPASISNWGAYGIAAGLAILKRDPTLLHDGATERAMASSPMAAFWQAFPPHQ